MTDKLDSITKKVTEMANQTTADYKQIQGLVHQRNVFYATIAKCQKICAYYINGGENQISAEEATNQIVEVLSDKNLIEEMQK